MSSTFKRRRRRTGSTSARFKPSQLVPVESLQPARIGKPELAACGAVVVVAATLIALVWLLTGRALQEQRTEISERAEQHLSGEAATIAETVGHELTMIDQSLSILQAAWKQDSDSVSLEKWQNQLPALTAVADDLFICDDQHVIRQDILPQAVGQGVGAAYVTFPHGSLEYFGSDGSKDTDALVLQGEIGTQIEAREFLIYVVRPLDHPKGWLIGASYRPAELTRLFAQGAIGFNPVVVLVDTRRGVLQAIVGPAARHPKTDLSQTPLLAMIRRSDSGTWDGESAIDGVPRLHAFRSVPGRDMAVLVAASRAGVMAPAEDLAASTQAVACVATGLIIAISGIVLWELYTLRGHRRQKRILDRNRSELDRLRSEETGNLIRAQTNAARMQVMLEHTTDGIAVFDSGFRLVQWNQPFSLGIGIEPRREMPLDTLLREQAAAGLFGPLPNPEAEVARRAEALRSGDAAGSAQFGPAQQIRVLRGLPIAEGGFLLILIDSAIAEPVSYAAPAPPQAPTTETGKPANPDETQAIAPIDW